MARPPACSPAGTLEAATETLGAADAAVDRVLRHRTLVPVRPGAESRRCPGRSSTSAASRPPINYDDAGGARADDAQADRRTRHASGRRRSSSGPTSTSAARPPGTWPPPAGAAAGHAARRRSRSRPPSKSGRWRSGRRRTASSRRRGANNATSQAANGGSEVTFTAGGRTSTSARSTRRTRWSACRPGSTTRCSATRSVETTYSDYRDFGGVMFPGTHRAHAGRTSGARPHGLGGQGESGGRHPGARERAQRHARRRSTVDGREARRRRLLPDGRHASQRRHRSGRSHRGRRRTAERSALAGGDREGQGDDPEQADPLPDQHARALRSLGRPAHLRGRRRDDRDARDEPAVLRAGVGGAADAQPGPAGAVEEDGHVRDVHRQARADRRQAHRSRSTTIAGSGHNDAFADGLSPDGEDPDRSATRTRRPPPTRRRRPRRTRSR